MFSVVFFQNLKLNNKLMNNIIAQIHIRVMWSRDLMFYVHHGQRYNDYACTFRICYEVICLSFGGVCN